MKRGVMEEQGVDETLTATEVVWWKQRKYQLMVAAGVLVAAVAVAGTSVWYTREQASRAAADCTTAAAAFTKAMGVKVPDRVTQARSVQAGQVSDAKMVDAFKKADQQLKASTVKPLSCATSEGTSLLREHADTMNRQAGEREKSMSVVVKSADSVLASRDAKSLADAHTKLKTTTDEGSRLLAESEGKVADNATRDRLQEAVNAAGTSLSKVSDVERVQASVRTAMDAVNASMRDKTVADEQAAAVQAATSTPAWTPTPTVPAPSYTQPRVPQRYYAPAAPARPAPAPVPAAPAQPAPSNGGGGYGGYNSWEDFTKNNTTGGNGCNAQGVCGIG